MAVATFDTLKFANTLKAAGVPEKQAEAQAAAFAEIIQLNFKELVTKEDLTATTKELRQEIKDAEQRVNARIDLVAAEVKTLRAELKGELLLLKWMMGVTFTGVLAAVGLIARVLFIFPR